MRSTLSWGNDEFPRRLRGGGDIGDPAWLTPTWRQLWQEVVMASPMLTPGVRDISRLAQNTALASSRKEDTWVEPGLTFTINFPLGTPLREIQDNDQRRKCRLTVSA